MVTAAFSSRDGAGLLQPPPLELGLRPDKGQDPGRDLWPQGGSHLCHGQAAGSPCCGMLSRDRDSSFSCPEAQHCSAKDFSLSLHLCCPLGSGDPWERSLFWLTVHALLILVPNSYTE